MAVAFLGFVVFDAVIAIATVEEIAGAAVPAFDSFAQWRFRLLSCLTRTKT